MRKVLYLEPVGGIAGDMFLALAIDLGVDPAALEAGLAGLGVPGWKLARSRAVRHAIEGTHVDVEVEGPPEHAHRPLSEIRALIERSTMSSAAKGRALAVFEAIGVAEAKIHGVPVEQIHFHEVGAIDSIVDICGAAVALDLLGDPEVYSAPPPLGSGSVRAAHGNIPVPAPATLELLRDLPVRFEGVGELTTPTGAGLLKALAKVGAPPEMTIERVGYGVGTKDFKDRPNVLRGTIGRPAHAASAGTFEVQANLDDCSPQLIGALVESLLAAGALDAYVLPATMKKGRPGHLLGAVVGGDARDVVIDRLLRESTTLGVRFQRVERVALERRFEKVTTEYGVVTVKLGLRNGEVLNAAPEFEDCRRLAEETKVPIKEVQAAALTAWRTHSR
jgi:uncharacterized protein (TIGR00299 family) protein